MNHEEPLLNGETESGSESSPLWPLYRPESHLTAESTNASLPACAPYVPMRKGASHFSSALSPQPRWPLPWGYNSTMQCLLNPVFEQLCEWVWRGQTFPYCSNCGVELVFALLRFATPWSPHRLWMGIKHQVAKSEPAKAPHREAHHLA